MLHDLKIIEPFYTAVKNGEKTFEIRENDREFKVGDTVHLRNYNPIEKKYIGNNVIRKRISYITDYGQKEGFVVFSIEDDVASEPRRG